MCGACVLLVLVPLASEADNSVQRPDLPAPQFESPRQVLVNTWSPAPATVTVAALRSGVILRSGSAKPDASAPRVITFTLKSLPTGRYRLCVSQQAIATIPANASYPAVLGWPAVHRCADQRLAANYGGSFGSNVLDAAAVGTKLYLQLRYSPGFNINGCAVSPGRSQFATLSIHRGQFAASIPYRNRVAREHGTGQWVHAKTGPIFNDRFTIRGTMNPRRVTGTIASSGAPCGRWTANLNLRYVVTY